MAIRVTCPTCGKVFKSPDEVEGREDHCPSCRTSVIVKRPEPIADFVPETQPIHTVRQPLDPIERVAIAAESIQLYVGWILAIIIIGIVIGIIEAVIAGAAPTTIR